MHVRIVRGFAARKPKAPSTKSDYLDGHNPHSQPIDTYYGLLRDRLHGAVRSAVALSPR